jgi:broad specificity phosphatase PhoE
LFLLFYLIRHGKTDYSERNSKIYQGFGVNLAPLSDMGIQEIKNTAKDIRLHDANIILSSPYTRALQTAAILSKELHIDISVETDLHEWMANKYYIYESDEQAERHYKEFIDSSGSYSDGTEQEWEDIQTLKSRFIAVLNKYKQYDKVIVACHGMLIQSVSGGYHPGNGEIVELDLSQVL